MRKLYRDSESALEAELKSEREAEMAGKNWQIEGKYVEYCSCDHGCPCESMPYVAFSVSCSRGSNGPVE